MIDLEKDNIKVSIIEDCGFTVSQILYKDKNILYFPFTVEEYKKNNELAGIPFLYPWANRLASDQFEIQQKKIDLRNLKIPRDGNSLPIHGLLLKTNLWRILHHEKNSVIAELHFDGSLLDYFPFRHRLEYKIQIQNHQVHFFLTIFPSEKLPISFGFHPYFSLKDYENHNVKIKIPAQSWIQTDERLIPINKIHIQEYYKKFNIQEEIFLDYHMDDSFTDFLKEGNTSVFEIFYPDQIVKIDFDENYKVCQIYYPYQANKNQGFVCIEPMITWTNGFISHHFETLEQKKEFYFKIEIIKMS